MRVGQGFDVHAFGEGDHVMSGRRAHRTSAQGVVAHSDGDVVIHALCDAVLGALGDGDIGRHFPDSDPRYRGADSRVFLRAVAARMRAAGLKLDQCRHHRACRGAAHRRASRRHGRQPLGRSRRRGPAHQHQGHDHRAPGIHRPRRRAGGARIRAARPLSVHGRRAEAWNRPALQPPRAHGTPLPPAHLQSAPEDFHVEERLSFEPSGTGPHWLLRVEKRTANTRWVAAEIARLAGVPGGDVGYAGLKDRQAVAVQWFSVPAAARRPISGSACAPPNSKCSRCTPICASSKSARCRATASASACAMSRGRANNWNLKLESLRAHGVPNYFGPQRFGREGYNLDRVAAVAAKRSGAARPRRAQLCAVGGAVPGVQCGAGAARRSGRLVATCGRATWPVSTAAAATLPSPPSTTNCAAACGSSTFIRFGPLWGRGPPASRG